MRGLHLNGEVCAVLVFGGARKRLGLVALDACCWRLNQGTAEVFFAHGDSPVPAVP